MPFIGYVVIFEQDVSKTTQCHNTRPIRLCVILIKGHSLSVLLLQYTLNIRS